MGNLGTYIGIGVVIIAGAAFFGGSSVQTADLGQALDRTERALIKYSEQLERDEINELTPKEIGELNTILTQEMNAPKRFYDTKVGVAMTQAASFIGFADRNANNIWEQGDDQLFHIEVDNENKRLIATDMSGNSTHLGGSDDRHFGGFLFISLGDRQRAAGITPDSFRNRKTTPRSAYRAPSSARSSARSRSRSGGIAGGK